MKKVIFSLLVLPSLAWCDTKISALTSTTTLNAGDVIPVVANPSATPLNRIITFQNFYAGIPSTITANSLGVLTESSATATYIQQSSASATYLQLSSATATYGPLIPRVVAIGVSTAAIAVDTGALTTRIISVGISTSAIAVDTGAIRAVVNGKLGISSITAVSPVQFSGAGVITATPISLSSQVVGNLPVTNLASGTNADSSHFWRGDGAWISSASFAGSGPTLVATQTWTGGNTFTSSSTFTGNVVISSGLITSGSAGTNGQFLTSGGPGTIPTWTTAAGGSGSKAPVSFNLDGSGVVISSLAYSLQAFYEMPYAATISSYTLSCDVATSTISIAVSTASASQFAAGTVPTSICASACPSLSSQRRKGDGVLTGWATSLAVSDYLFFDLSTAVPEAATKCLLQLLLS